MPLKIQDDYLQRFFSIAKVLSSTTGLTTVVADVSGRILSDCRNFNPFCTLVRADGRYCTNRQRCDKYCALEGLKHPKPRIPNCHVRLNLFFMPLVRERHLYGFILCGQARAKHQEYKITAIDNKCSWMDESKIKAEWSQVVVVDNNMLVVPASLLNFIVDNSETEQQQPDGLVIPPTGYTRHYFTGPSQHEKKSLEVLRYIDENSYSELSLESVAVHVYLSANYPSRPFRKRQGVNFRTWANQKKIQKAGGLLHDPVHSVGSIVRKPRYA